MLISGKKTIWLILFVLLSVSQLYIIRYIHSINYEIQSFQADIEVQRTLNNRNYEYLLKLDRENEALKSSSQDNPSREEDRGVTFIATAYTYTGNRTASGTIARPGVVAVDPKVIPLGSVVVVHCRDYPAVNGVYLAEDTGGVIKGNKIDIYMDSLEDCKQFGVRDVTVICP